MEISKWSEGALERVEEALLEMITSQEPILAEIATSVLKAGGKRVRPLVVLSTYRAAGGSDIEKIVPMAAATELIHSASLVHDDISDRSPQRRGLPTVHSIHDTNTAIVAGDFMFIRGFEAGGKYGSQIITLAARTGVKIVEGEILQSHNIGNIDLTEPEYMEIIGRKTASLFCAAAKAGAMIGGGTEEMVEAAASYGENLGYAFQIMDDILDVTADEKALGKPVAMDLRDKKMTLVTILACSDAENGKAVHALLEEIFDKETITDGDIESIRILISVGGSLDTTRKRALEYTERAKEHLKVLSEGDSKRDLVALADFVVQRKS